jgi:hypothetical protein
MKYKPLVPNNTTPGQIFAPVSYLIMDDEKKSMIEPVTRHPTMGRTSHPAI